MPAMNIASILETMSSNLRDTLRDAFEAHIEAKELQEAKETNELQEAKETKELQEAKETNELQ